MVLGLVVRRGVVMKTGSSTLLLLSMIVLGGCSAAKFSAKSNCASTSNCVSQQGFDVYEGTETIQGGKVDVLIVNDNSASMSTEQNLLAQRFNQFVAQFDQRLIDYRMATTTTDISSTQNPPRAINQNGVLQDGKLIPFSNGAKYLVPSSGTPSQKEQMFNAAIKRNETITCEQFITAWVNSGKSRSSAEYSQAYHTNCPSTDERGIYAANLVVQNNPDGFIRSEADLAIIFLADEDERSQLYWNNEPGYALEELDKHTTLVNNIKQKYPQKNFGLHAIIVKDQNCLNIQGSQLSGVVSGSYGHVYNDATILTGGVSGDICSSDYTQLLLSIFNNIQGKVVDKIALNCAAPLLEVDNITVSSSDSTITHSVVGSEIRFNKKLPVGSTVYYKYKCKQSAS